MAGNPRGIATGETLPLLLTCDQVALELGINRVTVYARLITPGILRSVQIGRSRRVARRDLEEYVERLRAGEIDDKSETEGGRHDAA
jgi:excisionase family DNA binding protein